MSPVTVPGAGLAVAGLGNKPFSCFPQDLYFSDWAERARLPWRQYTLSKGNPVEEQSGGWGEGSEHGILRKVKGEDDRRDWSG